jgi:hypothetical protein
LYGLKLSRGLYTVLPLPSLWLDVQLPGLRYNDKGSVKKIAMSWPRIPAV